MTNQAKLAALITSLADDLRPQVQKIESSFPTTKGHYGAYMHLISTLSNGNPGAAGVVVHALIVAGANEFGVKSALKICVG